MDDSPRQNGKLEAAEAALAEQIQLCELATEISAELMLAHADQVRERIDAALARMGDAYQTDRLVLWWRNEEADAYDRIGAWEREPTGRLPERLLREEIQALNPSLLEDRPTSEPDLGALPRSPLRDMLLSLGTKSYLGIPLRLHGEMAGILVSATVRAPREWTPPEITQFQVIGEIMTGRYANARAVIELEAALEEVRQLKDRLEEENVYLREEVRQAHGFGALVGESAALRHCLDLVAKVTPTDSNVLLLGETGTGKELLARAIHERSGRKDGPLVSVNCAALPPTLIESELFGHEKGAFTGADTLRHGRFELADGGTLFLDEIGDLPLVLQPKLLRALQEGEIERLGATRAVKIDVRVIAATHRDLSAAVARDEFRPDLYYRLSTFPIRVPPLRERAGDIPLLAEHLIRKHAPKLRPEIESISARMLRYMESRPWPGNVRELENFLQRALITSSGPILDLPPEYSSRPAQPQPVQAEERGGQEPAVSSTLLEAVERNHIFAILEKCGWRIEGEQGAAAALGLAPSSLRSRMARLEIKRPG